MQWNNNYTMDISNKSIVICSIVRDAAMGLRKNIPVIRELCNKFADYKVAVFENDSRDATKELLSQWMGSDPQHVFAYMTNTDGKSTIPKSKESTGNPFFGHKRIDRMAALRNQYMDLLWRENWEADYLMVVDLDVAKIDGDGVLSSFREDMEWDAVTAFGYSLGPTLKKRYHDTYALSLWGDETPQTERKIQDMHHQMATIGGKSQWVRVASAFGGLAIYKMEAVKGLRYKVLENADSRVEVLCEHYSIYRQMKERGYDQVYINPTMKIKYQEVTLKLIFNTIKRKLGL